MMFYFTMSEKTMSSTLVCTLQNIFLGSFDLQLYKTDMRISISMYRISK